jgi:two-component sensor histidine kinase
MSHAAAHSNFATLPRNGLFVVAFNTGIAVLLSAGGMPGGFLAHFTYSQCIGLLAWLLCDGGWRLFWPGSRPPVVPFAALLVGSILLASLGGTWLAARLLGHPWRIEGYLTALVITAAAGLFATLYFWAREHNESIERQVAEARLKLLQAQIEPHFLFNTLANLQALIPSDPARAQRMLRHLNEFLRAVLAGARKDRTTLADEFVLLRSYLEILAIRMGSRLRFRLELPEPLASAALPPMLLQPLVENAVRHGLEPKIDGGEVAVAASAENNSLVLRVADTGLGLDAARAPGEGTGTSQVRERLHALFGAAATLEIVGNADGGVTAQLRLPLER